jgi:hypothetical protein
MNTVNASTGFSGFQLHLGRSPRVIPRKYKKKGKKRTAKFFPRWDGPYRITKCHPEVSTYTLDIPTNAFPTFHASQLKQHYANDPTLFPSREFKQPGPILTPNGIEEYFVDEILDSRRHGKGWQFLVCWLSPQ